MKKLLFLILFLALIALGGFFYLSEKGHDIDSIIKRAERIDVKIECSKIEKLVVASTVTLFADNLSTRTHRNVTARVTGYDSKGKIVKQKEVSFLRKLKPNDSMFKVITLPKKVKRCECILINSNPD